MAEREVRIAHTEAHFLLTPGHELPEVERVVNRPHKRTVVVEKFNSVVAATVRRLNPRAGTASASRLIRRGVMVIRTR